jgi:hypothetical protein
MLDYSLLCSGFNKSSRFCIPPYAIVGRMEKGSFFNPTLRPKYVSNNPSANYMQLRNSMQHVLLEKLIVVQLAMEFPTFCGTPKVLVGFEFLTA